MLILTTYIIIYIYVYIIILLSTYSKFYKSKISRAKSAFYISKINNLTSNPRTSFALACKFLSSSMPINIPHIHNISKNELCYEFANNFNNKIQCTCTSISSILPISSIPCICISKTIPKYFSKFYIPSIFTMSNLISKYSSSHSSDPSNLAAFKKLKYTLSPYILDIIIISLNDSICPTSFKLAIITHILIKTLLDPNIIINYRPILQLTFLSKILNKLLLYI